MFKKLLVVGGALAVVSITAWSAPKVSRTKQIRDLLKFYKMDLSNLGIRPDDFKISPEKMAELVANGAFKDAADHLDQYLIYGDMSDYNAAEFFIIELRSFEREFKAANEAAATSAATATTEEAAPATEPVSAPVASDTAANDPAAPAAAA